MRWEVLTLAALTGCNAIFGLAPTQLRDDAGDDGTVDAGAPDAGPPQKLGFLLAESYHYIPNNGTGTFVDAYTLGARIGNLRPACETGRGRRRQHRRRRARPAVGRRRLVRGRHRRDRLHRCRRLPPRDHAPRRRPRSHRRSHGRHDHTSMITRTVTNPGARVTVRPMSGEALTTVAGASVSVRTIQEISYVSINISYVSIVPGH